MLFVLLFKAPGTSKDILGLRIQYSTVQYSTVAIFLLFFTSWIPNKLGPWTRVAVVGALKIYSSFFLYF